MMDLMRGTQFKPLSTSHTLVPQLMREELWPPEPLTQSSITCAPSDTDQRAQLPEGKVAAQRSPVLAGGRTHFEGCGGHCSNHSGLQVAAGEASLDTPLQRRAGGKASTAARIQVRT